MMSKEEWDKKANEIVKKNTAANIFNYINQIENKRNVYSRKWVWELLQNALDAKQKEAKNDVEIELNEKHLVFRHKGRPFEEDELLNLICHGSTKVGDEIGKFGTGFLTTHLLSRKVKVIGTMAGNIVVNFNIDREADSIEDMKSKMDTALNDCFNSKKSTPETSEWTVQYEYVVSDISSETAKEGIRDLYNILPYILAFNEGFNKVLINELGIKTSFVGKEEKGGDENHKLVLEYKGGKEPIPHELWLRRDREVGIEIAMKGTRQNDACLLDDLSQVPKVFLAFPLFNTIDVQFPVVINSRKFKPTQERDSIFLGENDTEDVKLNKKLIERAMELFIEMLSDLNPCTWKNVHNLLMLTAPTEKELDHKWYTKLLSNLVEELMTLKLLQPNKGDPIAPTDGYVPIIGESIDADNIERLWEAACRFTDYSSKVPRKDLVVDWTKIVLGWRTINPKASKIILRVDRIVDKIEECSNLENMQDAIEKGHNTSDTLNSLYELLQDVKRVDLLDKKHIFPNQNGGLIEKSFLRKDCGIAEVLKDISKKLGDNLRGRLISEEVIEKIKGKLTELKQEEVVNNLVAKIKQKQLTQDENYLKANIMLFGWLLQENELKHLEGYPILSSKEKIFSELNKDVDKLLIPKGLWKPEIQEFAEVFPQDYLISSGYYDEVPDITEWKKLGDKNLVRMSVLFTEKQKISGDEITQYLARDESLKPDLSHEIVKEQEIGNIAFLLTKDKGIMATVRKSKQKARMFLKFLFKHVVNLDKASLETVELECKCGSKHKLYRSIWLSKLKENKWVPAPSDQPLTSTNLAVVIEKDPELLKLLQSEESSKLLNALNVTAFEITLRSTTNDEKEQRKYDRVMSSLIGTFSSADQIQSVVDIATDNPQAFIDDVKEKMEKRRQIRKNQNVGIVIEKLLKTILEKEGFKVTKIRCGSDFMIEYDLVEDEYEVRFQIEKGNKVVFYIEIKCTEQDFVKMSYAQAEEAASKHDRYALCVVQLDSGEVTEENIKNSIKFVVDIGEKVKPYFEVAKRNKLKDRIRAEIVQLQLGGDVDLEITEGRAFFKIKEEAWEQSKDYSQFVEHVKTSQ